jgi:hypothetical protein
MNTKKLRDAIAEVIDMEISIESAYHDLRWTNDQRDEKIEELKWQLGDKQGVMYAELKKIDAALRKGLRDAAKLKPTYDDGRVG